MAFMKSPGVKYAKNFIIGVGASIVMLGALYKIQSWEMPTIGGVTFDLLTIGLGVEAFLFLLIALVGPDPDYYWDKLYPGLSQYDGDVQPLSTGGPVASPTAALNGEVVEEQLGGMLLELQTMSKSMSSLKALQEADFQRYFRPDQADGQLLRQAQRGHGRPGRHHGRDQGLQEEHAAAQRQLEHPEQRVRKHDQCHACTYGLSIIPL